MGVMCRGVGATRRERRSFVNYALLLGAPCEGGPRVRPVYTLGRFKSQLLEKGENLGIGFTTPPPKNIDSTGSYGPFAIKFRCREFPGVSAIQRPL